jgi:hypothetical protein
VETIETDIEQAPSESTEAIEVAEQAAEPASDTFPAETVRELRDELAKRRVKAREQTETANARLLSAYAAADGRLVEPDLLELSDDLLDDDGFIDRTKVATAIDDLLKAKPYLSARRPITPIVQGVQPQAPQDSGLFSLIRDRI